MQVEPLINSLKVSNLVAQCPLCEEEFKLADALLFDGLAKFPESAEEKRLLLLQEYNKRRKKLKERKLSAGIKAEKKAIDYVMQIEEEKDIQEKIKDMDTRIPTIEQIKDLIVEVFEEKLNTFKETIAGDTKIVNNENDIIEFSKQGYSCTPLGNGKWLMKN